MIDLGPDGGEKNGGHLVFEGTPEQLAQCTNGHTGRFLKKKMTEKRKPFPMLK